MNRFSKQVQAALGHYVYALLDPFDRSIFYVGKANSNSRAFDHLKSQPKETAKSERIEEIRRKGREPIVEILRYGLGSEASAFEVEASIIDALGIENLTNVVRGHGIEKGRLSLAEVEQLYGSEPLSLAEVRDPYMMFFLNRTYSTSLAEIDIYDATRQFWYNVAHEKRSTAGNGQLRYSVALSIYDSVVLRAYSIAAWFQAGTTLSTRVCADPENRWEFVGNRIEGHPMQGKRLTENDGSSLRANQQGYGYIN